MKGRGKVSSLSLFLSLELLIYQLQSMVEKRGWFLATPSNYVEICVGIGIIDFDERFGIVVRKDEGGDKESKKSVLD